MSDTRDAAIQKWRWLKAQQEAAVKAEREARDVLSALLFPEPVKGTQRYALGQGYNVKLVWDLDYKLGNPDAVSDGAKVPIVNQVVELEDSIAAVGNIGRQLAERLIIWKPELSVSEYKKLDPTFVEQAEIKALIDALLTTKPKAPQLSFEEPKAK